MAIYLCHEQPDLYEHDASVVASRPGAVALSRSAFHPGGGGQVSDVGAIEHADGIAAVVRVEPDGDIWWHVLDDDTATPGDDVSVTIDADHRLAVATTGTGRPLIKAANWLSHLEFDWESPVWRHFFGALAERNQLVRYDDRGNGLSDWDVEEISFEAFYRDLEHVADAVGLEKFALLGLSKGASTAARYAAEHPDRVSHLILCGGFATGSLIDASEHRREHENAMRIVMRAKYQGERQLPPRTTV